MSLLLHRSLAQVEWQLIMQMCDLQSMIHLAQCSKTIRQAASNDFAWRFMPPVMIQSTQPDFADRITRSLLRYASFKVHLCDPIAAVRSMNPSSSTKSHLFSTSAVHRATVVELASLASIPRIIILDCSLNLSPGSLDELLQMDSNPLRHLTSLNAPGIGMIDVATLQLLALHCSNLRTLHLQPFKDRYQTHLNLFNELVHQLSGLTALSLHACVDALEIQPLTTLMKLQRLNLRGLDHDAWNPLLTAANMQSLRHLTLERVEGRYSKSLRIPLPAIDWTKSFSNLHSLRSLTLVQCGAMYSILSSINEAQRSSSLVSLRLLCIHVLESGLMDINCCFHSDLRRFGTCAPSVTQLEHFLDVCHSKCHLILCIPSKDDHVTARSLTQYVPTSADPAVGEAEWEASHARYSYLRDAHSEKMELKLISSRDSLNK